MHSFVFVSARIGTTGPAARAARLVRIGLLVLAAQCACFSAMAAERLGDWSYQPAEPYYAATINDSGGIFGQWCDLEDQSCIYLVGLSVACEDNASYPVLINTDSGAVSMTIVCRGRLSGQNLYRYAFSNFDQVDATVRGSKRIGIAMPMRDDQFRVSRFSLDGAKAALDSMREAVQRTAKRQQSGTRDQRL